MECSGDDRVEAGDERAEESASGGTNDATSTGARSACTESGPAGTGTHLRADSADAASGRVLHDADIDAENLSTSLGAQHIGIGNIQVVARDGDVEIILQSQSDGIIQRKIELAVVHQLSRCAQCSPDSARPTCRGV